MNESYNTSLPLKESKLKWKDIKLCKANLVIYDTSAKKYNYGCSSDVNTSDFNLAFSL